MDSIPLIIASLVGPCPLLVLKIPGLTIRVSHCRESFQMLKWIISSPALWKRNSRFSGILLSLLDTIQLD